MNKDSPFILDAKLSEDSITLGQFSLSRLLLIKDKQFPWFVLVPQIPDVTEVYQLNSTDQEKLWLESSELSKVLMKHFNGDKLNIAAIGNVVSQLHIHHVIRYKNDKLWPAPIWGQLPMKLYQTDELNQLLNSLRSKLEAIGLKSVKI